MRCSHDVQNTQSLFKHDKAPYNQQYSYKMLLLCNKLTLTELWRLLDYSQVLYFT